MVQGNLQEAKGADIVEGYYRTLVHSQLVCLSYVFRAENEVPLALTSIYTGQKVCQAKRKKITHKPLFSYLVHKLLHTRLQAPDFKLHGDKFVGAHDGILSVDPSFLQEASVSLLRLKIPQVL